MVFSRPRRTGAGPGVHLAGSRHGAHAGSGHAGRLARAAEDFIPEAAMTGRILSVVGGMFLLPVCSKGDQGNAAPARQPLETTPPPAAASSESPPPSAGGTITGKVKFTGTAPRAATIDMSEEAACKAKYPTPPKEETVTTGPANALANGFGYVSAGLPANAKYQAPSTPAVLNQDGR